MAKTQAQKIAENAALYHAITGKVWNGDYYGVYAAWNADGSMRDHAYPLQVQKRERRVMAFMEMQTCGPETGVEVETREGTFVYPANTWHDVRGEFDVNENPALTVTPIHGYFGRYSAPGYLDCTDWHFDTSLEALEAELREMYGDDDDDDDEVSPMEALANFYGIRFSSLAENLRNALDMDVALIMEDDVCGAEAAVEILDARIGNALESYVASLGAS